MRHAIAAGLRGFRRTDLRVRIIREEAGLVWVRTADLSDAGTPLVLDAGQIRPEPEADPVLRHRDGLVAFA